MKIQCLIIEDEIASQEILTHNIKAHFPKLNITSVIDNAPEAIEYLNNHKVDIVFVDNHIKRGKGIDIINKFNKPNFLVIFITAFSEYAIDALNNGASYYLLKPYNENEFIQAVEKTLEGYSNIVNSIVIGSNKENISHQSIIFLKSEGAYTIFHLEGGRTIYTSRNLGYYQKNLPSRNFHRIHHSTIVNTSKILSIKKTKGISLVLKNGSIHNVSNRRLKEFTLSPVFQTLNFT